MRETPASRSDPRVSIILIFLNDERFLDEAVQSVMQQTFSDWELLLVDDGSTDASTAIAQRYAAGQVGRIRYLEHRSHANLGKSASRNLGLREARGEYLLCLDSDDILLPHALAVLTGLGTRYPSAAMIYGPLEYWYSWTTPPYKHASDFVQPLGVAANELIAPPNLLMAFLQRRAAVPSGMLVRTSVAQEVGGYEEAFRWMYDDQVFCAKVCLAWPVLASSTCVYRYRQHSASSSTIADQSGEYEFGRLTFLEWLFAYLRSNGRRDPLLWRALRNELWWVRHPRLGRLRKLSRRASRRLARIRRGLSIRRAKRPSEHATEHSHDVSDMAGGRPWIRAGTAESKSKVMPEKP